VGILAAVVLAAILTRRCARFGERRAKPDFYHCQAAIIVLPVD
jgi:hypothetical protein